MLPSNWSDNHAVKVFGGYGYTEDYPWSASCATRGSAAGHWMAEGGPTATLYAQCDAEVKGGGWWEIIDTSDTSEIQGRIWVDSCCDELSGEVVNKNGEICLANNFCTTGDLTLESVLVSGYASEPYIHVKKQALAHFKAAAGCAGATCPYCP